MSGISTSTAPVPARPSAAPSEPVPLEPTPPSDLVVPSGPTLSERGVGGAIGGATGVLGGAGVMAAMNDFLTGRKLWLVPLAGLVSGAAVGASIIIVPTTDARRAKLEAQHGVATIETARREIAKYDKSGNGSIELSDTSGLLETDERVVAGPPQQGQRLGSISSAERFAAADVAPRDGVVTAQELARLMSRFDSNRNGVMSPDDLKAFDAANPVLTE